MAGSKGTSVRWSALKPIFGQANDHKLGPDYGMALLKAVAYNAARSGDDLKIDWPSQSLILDLLRCDEATVPRNPSAFESYLRPHWQMVRRNAVNTLTWDGATYAVQYEMQRRDGETIWVEERAERLSGKGEEPHQVRGVLQEITRLKRSEERAARASFFDEKTGLWHPEKITELIAHERALTQYRKGEGYVVGLKVNAVDDLGRNFGSDPTEFIVQTIARRLSEDIKPPAYSARLDELAFAIFIPICTFEQAREVSNLYAEWIRDHVGQTPYGDLYLSCHVSIQPIINASVETEGVLEKMSAELKIDTTKKRRSAGLTPLSYAMSTYKQGDPITAKSLTTLIDEDKLQLVYQPVVSAKTGETALFEGLLRVEMPDGAILSAFNHIIAAEKYGLVHRMDMKALEIGLSALDAYPDLRLSLNLSPGTAMHRSAMENYIRKLNHLGPGCERLTIELTETMALEKPDVVQAIAAQLRKLGCRFAIDDFGAGFTSFQNMLSVEADIIKIDGTLIRDIAFTSHNHKLVGMIVGLAQTLGLETIAEYVNERTDANLLRRLGVDYFQGYMFGKPGLLPEAYENTRGKSSPDTAD